MVFFLLDCKLHRAGPGSFIYSAWNIIGLEMQTDE